MIIPANPNAQYQSYKKDIDSALKKVISSGRYILGEEVKEFEKELSDDVKQVDVDANKRKNTIRVKIKNFFKFK